MPQKVTIKTSDGFEIVGDFYPSSGDKFAILLHMMPATKASWAEFALKLVAAGYTCLAIDERGHGESTMGGTLDYKTFGEKEQQSKIHDVEAAYDYLEEKGGKASTTVLIGGSIGANLAIQFLSEHSNVRRAVALSPGLNYRGVKTDTCIASLARDQYLLLIASDDDTHTAYESSQRLHELNPGQTTLLLKSGVGHATDILSNDPTIVDVIIAWLAA